LSATIKTLIWIYIGSTNKSFVQSRIEFEVSAISAIIAVCRNVIERAKLLTVPHRLSSLTQTFGLANRGSPARIFETSCWLRSLLAAVSLLAFWIQPSYADQQDETFLIYAVKIAMPTWQGNGIYLGKGLFLTAAHVVGRVWLTRPKIVIGAQTFATRVVKEGASGGIDLALLAVEESLLPMRL
jgi:hypothetical protein